jgi:uncharacterized protein (TIGR02646 family)
MMRWHRSDPPPPLLRWAPELTEAFIAERSANPSHRFRWAQRAGVNLGEVIREALEVQNHGHCCYCDAYPIGAAGRQEVDHFRPKSRFPEAVYDWANLYLGCTACNSVKADQWDEDLLRSDAADYEFQRYFVVDGVTGAIAPNSLASPAEQQRARRTIEVFDLDSKDRRIARRKTIRAPDFEASPNERAYRFL